MTSYRVGDWVYCETSPHQPYVIRKIEELTKTPCGNVEAKVICAFRRQDIPAATLATIEKYQSKNNPNDNKNGGSEATATGAADPTENSCDFEESDVSNLNEQQRYNLKHRELYFSKYTDTIAATTIRAKCSVLLFNEEVERYSDYLVRDDSFFYHLTYDPYQKSIVADKGEIRVGLRYQAEVPQLKQTVNGVITDETNSELTAKQTEQNDRVLRSQLQKNGKEQVEVPFSVQNLEQLHWSPIRPFPVSSGSCYDNQLTDAEIDQFLILAKSVGTYARALDCNNSFKQPSLPLSAASASRDITLFYAMDTLHEHGYDIGKAALSMITPNGPVICKDEGEDWSAAEANLFEEAIDKFGKDFNEIRKEYLSWKTLKSIIEYYYTWKTTDRYVQQKRIKLSEQESKLKQVYIPNHSKQNQSALIKSMHVQLFNQYDTQLKQSCESCGTPNTSTNQWYAYNLSALTQLIMTGNHNPTALANAAAQLASTHSLANNHIHLQARLCADCWTYWKKFSAFKFPNARQERLNQLKNQMHKCSVNGCGREFKVKQLLIKHCGIAHGYFAKTSLPPGQNSPRPAAIRNRTSFYLLTTPMTQAARLACTNSVRLKKLARKPFKLVELIELNKEWNKETRNIQAILDEFKKKVFEKRKLSKELIAVISKSYMKLLKRKKQTEAKKALNGQHQDSNNEDEEEDSENELVIDNDTEAKPEFLKYFEQKCATPCYVPEKLIYAKPTADQMNKFYTNLMTQNRKRTHDASNGNGEATIKNENLSSTDTSPLSKRSLLSNQTGKPGAQLNGKPNIRMPQKSIKPTQSSDLVNAPEDIYYVANRSLKSLRREIQNVAFHKLARKPYKQLGQEYDNLYDTVAKIRTDALVKLVKKPAGDSKSIEEAAVPSEEKLSNGDEAEVEMKDEMPSLEEETEQSTKSNELETIKKESVVVLD